jgi:type IV pilus assembly protein PilX
MRRHPNVPRPGAQQGVVLPIALIMLLIISFAGLLAARSSATFEQFSSNMRTNQVSRVSAEDALRRCERIARYSVEETTIIPAGEVAAIEAAKARIVTAEITADDDAAMRQGAWNTRANWAEGAVNLITITPQFDGNVQTNAQIKEENYPTCIVQAMVNDRFLVTARGLSNDAQVGDDGVLTEGSEVWLQSILTPTPPTQCGTGGC